VDPSAGGGEEEEGSRAVVAGSAQGGAEAALNKQAALHAARLAEATRMRSLAIETKRKELMASQQDMLQVLTPPRASRPFFSFLFLKS
jgi:hypothetical protein